MDKQISRLHHATSTSSDRINRFFIRIFYSLAALGLFFYSFTQVDLGLTLTRWPFWLPYQQFFQHIGYFNRPLSTTFYITILALFFVLYVLLLFLAYKHRTTKKEIWVLLVIVGLLLTFSYNAFSHDIFNYVFDARIFTYYGQNPYEHKALDFPADPMLGFMHWTHRTYPYGPIWLLLSLPLSFLGFQALLPTLLLFKMLAFGSFIGTVYFFEKILEKIDKEKALVGTIFFSLNPLVLIESLVSGHNDIVMMFFALAGFYFLLEKKYARAYLLLILSIGIKFATIFLFPVFLGITILQIQKKQIVWDRWTTIASLSMGIAIIFASFRSEFQPWYLLWVLPFLSLLVRHMWIVSSTAVISFSVLFYYALFFYFGNWDAPVPTFKLMLGFGAMVISCTIICAFWYKNSALFNKQS